MGISSILVVIIVMKYLVLLCLSCSAMADADADPQYGYAGYATQGVLGHPYGYGAGILGHPYSAGLPYTYHHHPAAASLEDTPASAVRLAATVPYTGYGHTLPYGYAGYAAYPGYAHPGYAYPGWGYAPPAAAAAKDE